MTIKSLAYGYIKPYRDYVHFKWRVKNTVAKVKVAKALFQEKPVMANVEIQNGDIRANEKIRLHRSTLVNNRIWMRNPEI